MATATKSIADQIAELELKRGKLHAKAREARAKRDEWDRELMLLRAQNSAPGLDEHTAQTLRAEIRGRIAQGNPAQVEYDKALEPFHELDEQLQEFKLGHVREWIAEESADEEIEGLRAALEQLAVACDAYARKAERVHQIVMQTPRLMNHPGMDGHDPRPAEWMRMAEDALASEIVRPGLTPAAEHRLAH